MAYTLADILNGILTAIQDILGNIASAVADNAAVIASVIVLGGLIFGVVRFGSAALRRVMGLIRVF